jgi:hypothetical protein
MARKKAVRKSRQKAPLHEVQQEQSTLSIWLWVVGGLIVLALVFALIEIFAAKLFG